MVPGAARRARRRPVGRGSGHPARAVGADGRSPIRTASGSSQLARHELVVAFRSARLRETLERERGELTAVVDGTTDLIVQVDAERRVVRLNPAGERLLGIRSATRSAGRAREVLGCDGRRRPRAGRLSAARGHDDRRADAVSRDRDPRRGRRLDPRRGRLLGGGADRVRTAGRRPGGRRRRRSSATSAPSAPSRSCARASSRRSATNCARRCRSSAATPRRSSTWSSTRPSSATISSGSTRSPGACRRLVGQILDVTHLQADPLILERAPVLFAALVTRLRGDLETSGRADRLSIDLPTDLPPIEVDAARVGQILENLVENAFKYGPAGRHRRHLGASRRGVAGGRRRRRGGRDPRHGTGARHGTVPSRLERPRIADPGNRPRAVHLPAPRRGARRPALAGGPAGRPAGTRVVFTLPLLRGRRPVPAQPRRRSPNPCPGRGRRWLTRS